MMRKTKIIEVRISGDHKDCHVILEDGSVLDGLTFVEVGASVDGTSKVKMDAIVYSPKPKEDSNG